MGGRDIRAGAIRRCWLYLVRGVRWLFWGLMFAQPSTTRLSPNSTPDTFSHASQSRLTCDITMSAQVIDDPGNGPRVRDVRAFLDSYFAQPPSLDDPLCAAFASEEILQMLEKVLPQETALVSPLSCSLST
jgi:hypothetical protein